MGRRTRLSAVVGVTLAIAVLVIGVGIAQAKKKNHVLSADYKTSPIEVLDETPTTLQLGDDAKLVGRPFGNLKAHLTENSLITYNQPRPSDDYSGTEHTTFRADFYASGATFRGYYDQTLDSNGSATGPINGVITGGSRLYRGAKGSFQVQNLTAFHLENVQYMGHWQGSIRY
jgi:hypothetical protein